MLTRRSLIRARQGSPESELEARFVELVAAHHLPPPARQIDLGDGDSWIGRVDFVWSDALLVVEVDGAAFHDGLVDRRNDEDRDRRLTADGWTICRFRWDDVVNQPAEVAAQIRQLLR